MCGICGVIDLRGSPVPDLERRLEVMNDLLAHRGPDEAGIWVHERGHVGLGNRRLSIIDLENGHQPMSDEAGRWIAYNGEVYNYPEVRAVLGGEFPKGADTEVVLRAYGRWGAESLDRLRGMYAFAIWDETEQELFLARDRFGIKPLYYTVVGDVLHFASEAKALMPFLPSIQIDLEGFKDYLAFQFCLAGKTLFKDVRELLPGHFLRVGRGPVVPRRYWEVFYELDWDHAPRYFEERLRELMAESVGLHLRSDVPVSAYVSGGVDSSAIAALASRESPGPVAAFTGRFREDPAYDESAYARALADHAGLDLHVVDIGVDDFVHSMADVAYYLDYPTAGPGSLPQYVVARAAAQQGKVILGGQGGDEIFGGYTRYLMAYFEQCIKAAIDGTLKDGNFVVTYESIIPNLVALRGYEPLLQHFWRDGLFAPMDGRYFRLINRMPERDSAIDLEALGNYSPFESFQEIFNGSNVGHEAYFDKMTHFDFKTLLPALLQVEDRMAMAHGLESRVPLLDHRLVEFAATIPADVKFRDGTMKHVFKRAVAPLLPDAITKRTDKMGFPVPLTEWMRGPARDFLHDTLGSQAARDRSLVDNRQVLEGSLSEGRFGRRTWGLLSLELWQQAFHDRERDFKRLITEKGDTDEGADNGRGRVHRLAPGRPAGRG
jgi:asparagine synthase (glutamine-hydrolysing)